MQPTAHLSNSYSFQARNENGEIGETIASLVDQYAETLYRIAYSVLRNSADAEDSVQEAFLRVLLHRDQLCEVRDHRVWLIRIVWNIAIDRKRRVKRRPETFDIALWGQVATIDELSATDRAAAIQHRSKMLECVDQLPAKEREVLQLSAFEELGSVEIAKILNTSPSTVRSRLYRARNLLAATLHRQRKTQGQVCAFHGEILSKTEAPVSSARK